MTMPEPSDSDTTRHQLASECIRLALGNLRRALKHERDSELGCVLHAVVAECEWLAQRLEGSPQPKE